MIDVETILDVEDEAESVRNEIKPIAFNEDNVSDAWNYLNNANRNLMGCESKEVISDEDVKPIIEDLNDAIKSLNKYMEKFDNESAVEWIDILKEARDLLGGGEGEGQE